MPKRVRDTAGTRSALEAAGDSDDREDVTDAERDAGTFEAPEPAPTASAPKLSESAGTSGGIPESQTTPAIGAPAIESDEWAEADRLAAELAEDTLPGEPAPGLEAEQEPASAQEPSESASELERSESQERARAGLRMRGGERTALLGRLERKERELFADIRAAHAAGVPKLTIAKDAGVARQTVYNVLGKDA